MRAKSAGEVGAPSRAATAARYASRRPSSGRPSSGRPSYVHGSPTRTGPQSGPPSGPRPVPLSGPMPSPPVHPTAGNRSRSQRPYTWKPPSPTGGAAGRPRHRHPYPARAGRPGQGQVDGSARVVRRLGHGPPARAGRRRLDPEPGRRRLAPGPVAAAGPGPGRPWRAGGRGRRGVLRPLEQQPHRPDVARGPQVHRDPLRLPGGGRRAEQRETSRAAGAAVRRGTRAGQHRARPETGEQRPAGRHGAAPRQARRVLWHGPRLHSGRTRVRPGHEGPAVGSGG